MKLGRLVAREIRHRKTNFLLSLIGVAMAVLSVLAAVALLRAHDLQSDRIIAEMESDTKAEMTRLEDEIRKTMKGLGFNIYIFPKDQDMSEVYAEGFASKTMPESYSTRLAESKIVTVNHLLPSLTRKLEWPEKKRTVLLIGVRGEIPLAHRGGTVKSPLINPVEKGKLVLGYELHRSLGIEVGDKTEFMGRAFEIAKCHAERGTKDDITIWMDLGECQDLLGEQGRINAIQALECNCATVDRLGEIRAELMAILPDTQITETGSKALARAEARNHAKSTAKKRIDAAREDRARLRREREKFAGVLLPVVILFAMAWVTMLAFINVRERVSEIGIFRAMGVKTRTILATFLSRAALAGAVGSLVGIAVFAAFYPLLREKTFSGLPLTSLLHAPEWLATAVAAPILACLAAWLPSLAAAQKDPADVLRQD